MTNEQIKIILGTRGQCHNASNVTLLFVRYDFEGELSIKRHQSSLNGNGRSVIQEVCGSFGTFLTKSDEREEELLKFLNNVNSESCGILEIFGTITKYVSPSLY